jgi:hypothetical protein
MIYSSETFRKALVSTNGANLTHCLGGKDTRKTEYAFISRLAR